MKEGFQTSGFSRQETGEWSYPAINMCYSSRKGKNDLKGSSTAGGSVIDIWTLRPKAQGAGQPPPQFQDAGPHHDFQRVGSLSRSEAAGPPPKAATPVGPEGKTLNQRDLVSNIKNVIKFAQLVFRHI